MLQCVAGCFRVRQGVALAVLSAENVLWNLDVFSESSASSGVFYVLQCVAVCCSVLQDVSVCCSV